MAEKGIGALLVHIGADVKGLVDGLDKADKAVGKFSSAVDRRLLTPLAKFTAAAATAGAAIGMFAKKVNDLVDEAATTAEKLSMTVESFTALSYAANIADVEVASFTTGMRLLSKNMLDAQAGTGEAKDAFRALGIAVQDSSGKLRTSEAVLLDLAEKFARMEDGAGKTALAMRIFGRSGADLLPLLNKGRGGIEELRKEAERLGVVFTKDMAEAADEFDKNLKRLQASAEGMAVKLSGPLINGLNNTAEAFLEAQKEGAGFLETLSRVIFVAAMGDDLHNTQRQFITATEALARETDRLNAVNQEMLAAHPGLRAGWQKQVDMHQRVVDKLTAEVELLQRRKQMLEEGKNFFLEDKGRTDRSGAGTGEAAPGLSTEDAPWTPSKDFLDPDAEFDERVKADNKKRDDEFKAQQLEAELLYQEELERIKFEASEAQKNAAIQLQEDLARIERDGIQSRMDWEKATSKQRVKSVFADLAQMTAGVAQHSRALFNINKVAGIANAIINTSEGITKALSAYPPPLSFAMAAAQAAAGFAQVNAIRSTSFGGGGSAPSVAGTPAPPVTPVGGGAGGSGEGGRSSGISTIINLHGETFGRDQLRKLVDEINENARDGGRIIVQ